MLFVILGCVVLLIILSGIYFFYRIGKPVNATLSDAYYHHAWKKKIVYSPMGNWFELGYYETEADPTTFTVIAQEYGKDNQFVFWKGRKQAVDFHTFRVDEERIPKDGAHVYYDLRTEDTLMIVTGADPKTYHLYKEGSRAQYQFWYHDERSIYVEGKRIAVDRQTFARINVTLAMDKNYVYAIVTKNDKSEVLQKLDHPTGEVASISDNYARIGNSIILSNWKTEFALVRFSAIDSMRVLDERNIVVNNQLIHDGAPLPEVEVSTWQELGRDHFKDRNNVYYDGQKINNADPQTFEIISEFYSKDREHVFYKQKILNGVKPASFTYQFNTGLATDGELFFKEGVLVKSESK